MAPASAFGASKGGKGSPRLALSDRAQEPCQTKRGALTRKPEPDIMRKPSDLSSPPMNIPTFWIKERRRLSDGTCVHLRGVSNSSMDEARAKLEERARIWEQLLSHPKASREAIDDFRRSLRRLDGHDEGPYSAGILEPIEQRLDDKNIVTRNRYGSLVLNTTRLCFADVDHFPPRGLRQRLAALFHGKRAEQRLLEALDAISRSDEHFGARLYRTAHGWRIILRKVELGSEQQRRLFADLNVDPLYTKLCDSQQCWRARLSPKPFHLGLPRFPRLADSLGAPEVMADWVTRYEERTAQLAVCRLIDTVGRSIADPVLDYHDRTTQALKGDLPLG